MSYKLVVPITFISKSIVQNFNILIYSQILSMGFVPRQDKSQGMQPFPIAVGKTKADMTFLPSILQFQTKLEGENKFLSLKTSKSCLTQEVKECAGT